MEPLLPGLSTFFSWLIDYSVDISILICLIFIIRLLVFRKLPAWWHYSLWVILLSRMIIPWRFKSPFNIPDVVHISIDEGLFGSLPIEEEITAATFSPELPLNPQGLQIQVDDLLLFIWLACAVIFGMYILVKNIEFWNSIRNEPPLTEKKVLNVLEECKGRMKIRAPLQITVTEKVKSPALFGYIRPRLLLPAGVLEKLDGTKLHYIFMHELTHLKRHDIGVSWIITFIQIFQWFNPFVWLAFHQMRLDQESACDASVLSRIRCNQTIDYAGTIISFLENFYRNRRLPALVGILENQTHIKKRITMIINYKKNSRMMMLFSTALLFAIAVIFFSLAGFAKENYEQPVSDSSILQTLPFEIQGYPAVHNGIIKEENATILAKAVPMSSVIEDRGVMDMIKHEQLNRETQTTLAKVRQNNTEVSREEMAPSGDDKKLFTITENKGAGNKQEKKGTNPETQTALADVHKNNTGDGKMAPDYKGDAKKTPVEALNVNKEEYNNYPESINILEYYLLAAAYEGGQSASTAQTPEKIYTPGEERNVKYQDLAGSAYPGPENKDNAAKTRQNSENSPANVKIHDLSDVDEKPKIVGFSPTIYPFKARERGIEGRVLLRFIVNSAGDVQDPQVVSAEPEGVFEQAALDTVTRYRIKPAMKDGKNVSSLVKLPISFTMNDNHMRFARK